MDNLARMAGWDPEEIWQSLGQRLQDAEAAGRLNPGGRRRLLQALKELRSRTSYLDRGRGA